MSTLYKPVLIESAGQAEALPDGSMAYLDTTDAYRQPCRLVATKHRGAWWVDDRRDSVIGWAALVPIEAEEEGTREFCGSNGTWHMTPPVDAYQSPHARLVTPWEEA